MFTMRYIKPAVIDRRYKGLLFTEDFSRRDHCIAVDRNGIFDMSGVSTGQCDHHGCVSRLRKTQYKLIPFLQPINGQSQPAELILTIWIGTGKIVDQVWLKFAAGGCQSQIQPVQILFVIRAIRKVHVDGRWWLNHRVIVRLMQRYRKDLWVSCAAVSQLRSGAA